jgi:hypothetical protein
MRRTSLTGALFIATSLLFATSTYATAILPGDTNIGPLTLYPNASIVPIFDSGPTHFSFGPTGEVASVVFEFLVFPDPASVPHLYSCGASCLDFGLVAELVSGPAAATSTTLEAMGLTSFGAGSATKIDVGYVAEGGSAVAPSTASRTASGNQVAFQFVLPGIPIGTPSDFLLLRTNMTSWDGSAIAGFEAHEVFPGRDPIGVVGLAPAGVPEPATLTLTALGLAGAAIRRRRRSRSAS